jgi:Flp pilus assembly protein TadG
LSERREGRGQVLPLVALCLAVLTGLAGMAVDIGYWEYQQRQRQIAADGAAAGAAQQLIYAGCPNKTAARTAAYTDAANRGLPNSGNVTVTVQNPPSSGPYANNNCAVFVQITSKHVATLFGKLFARGTGVGGTIESNSAIGAVVTANNNPCIYLLGGGVGSSFNGANVRAPGCGIVMNDSASFRGATISARSISYAGIAPNVSGARFSEATPAPEPPVTDPCPEIAGCEYLATDPPAGTSCQSVNDNGKTVTIKSGCYANLNLDDASVTFEPGGLFVVESMNLNGARITGNGVTFYVPANSRPPNFSGVSDATLAPPASGDYRGVLYYQVPSNLASPNFNARSIKLRGLVYAPGATSVNFNGAKEGYLVLVVGSVNFSGGIVQNFATPAPGRGLIKNSVLAE